ncbi:copper homeostasis protein CutC [Vibrio taketomensis]|uniref:copper homeostasis protein CutC n=1 Tax=Vibrio taketomensis TaxID=2572923 RepID=UPI00138A18F4|nr:copper homeostasis protein CutC [Vibrio taketomensis]
MTYQVEVCIDNLESLHYAIEGGANRIELCSSLALGGLTPSFGFMRQAAILSSVPVYAMIRPRQGDFLYSEEDIESMLLDIDAAAQAGLQGVVFGTLTATGDIDIVQAHRLAERAKSHNLGITFHRAIDQCADYAAAIEALADLGCERILTSGLAANAELGIEVLTQMVKVADGRLAIMAGAGVNPENAARIAHATGVKQLHLSGKTTRPSHMELVAEQAKMGNQDLDDFIVPITSSDTIAKVVNALG